MFLERGLSFFFLLTLKEYKVSDSPDLSLLKIFCLFARSPSLIVLINLSIFPFPDVRVPGIFRVLFRTDYRIGQRLRLQKLCQGQFLFFAVLRIELCIVLKIRRLFSSLGGVKILLLAISSNGLSILVGTFSLFSRSERDRQNLTLFLRFVRLLSSISLLDFVVAYILDSYQIAGIGRIVGLDPLPPGGYAATRYLRSLITLSRGPDGHIVVNTLS